MTEVKREIMCYRVDGIFINRWDGSGMCYCEHCSTISRPQATRFAADGHPRTRRAAPILGVSSGSTCGRPGTAPFARQSRFMRDSQHRGLNSPLDAVKSRSARADAGRGPPGASRVDGALGIGLSAKEYRAALGPKPVVASSASAWRKRIAGRTRCRTRLRSGCGRRSRRERNRPWFANSARSR